jgi:hypothetical protein
MLLRAVSSGNSDQRLEIRQIPNNRRYGLMNWSSGKMRCGRIARRQINMPRIKDWLTARTGSDTPGGGTGMPRITLIGSASALLKTMSVKYVKQVSNHGIFL